MKQQCYFVDVIWVLIGVLLVWKYVPASPRFYAGMSLVAVSFVLWMVARVQLGASFTATAQARKLVTAGLYSKFCNPIYLFGQFSYLGLAIAWNTLAGYIVFASIIPLQMARAKAERFVLEEAFGDEYRAYRARTWF